MIGLLLVTHGNIGKEMLEATQITFGRLPLPSDHLSIERDADPEAMLDIAREKIQKLDQGNGILVLTDIYGSTPSNIAHALRHEYNSQVITGVSLPMLFRIYNYAHLDLAQITQKAVSGGKDGIVAREPTVRESL